MELGPACAVPGHAATPEAGPAYLWVVLRDGRGGVAFAGYAVTIAP